MFIIRFILLAGALVVLFGCGGTNSGQMAISGSVSYAGEAIQKGSITFRPEDPTQRDVSAAIADGGYQIDAKSGPKAGEYTVKVDGFHMQKPAQSYVPDYLKSTAANNPNSGLVPTPFVPEKYNKTSQLKVKFEAGKATYDFKLEK